MRFLLDQNLSPLLTDLLAQQGHDAVHVRELGMSRSSDADIMAVALAEDRIVISSDTDRLWEVAGEDEHRRTTARAVPPAGSASRR